MNPSSSDKHSEKIISRFCDVRDTLASLLAFEQEELNSLNIQNVEPNLLVPYQSAVQRESPSLRSLELDIEFADLRRGAACLTEDPRDLSEAKLTEVRAALEVQVLSLQEDVLLLDRAIAILRQEGIKGITGDQEMVDSLVTAGLISAEGPLTH
jgi:hypothetical protein